MRFYIKQGRKYNSVYLEFNFSPANFIHQFHYIIIFTIFLKVGLSCTSQERTTKCHSYLEFLLPTPLTICRSTKKKCLENFYKLFYLFQSFSVSMFSSVYDSFLYFDFVFCFSHFFQLFEPPS